MDHLKPRAAPNVFPMPYHRTIAEVDRADAISRRFLEGKRRAALARLANEAVSGYNTGSRAV